MEVSCTRCRETRDAHHLRHDMHRPGTGPVRQLAGPGHRLQPGSRSDGRVRAHRVATVPARAGLAVAAGRGGRLCRMLRQRICPSCVCEAPATHPPCRAPPIGTKLSSWGKSSLGIAFSKPAH